MYFQVETIGDAYMVAGNLTSLDGQHAATVLRFALRAQQEAAKVLRPDRDDGAALQLRIGEALGDANGKALLGQLCTFV